MTVRLLNTAAVVDSLHTAILAGLTCTANGDRLKEYHSGSYPTAKGIEFLSKLIARGHESVLEHVSLSFYVTGIRRGLLQEIARHRHTSLSVESTRWALSKVLKNETALVFPEKMMEGFDVYDAETRNTLADMEDALHFLVDGIAKVSAVVPNDRLKDFLPECFTCNLVITLNLRELRHIYKLRTSQSAWKPFRELCENMLQTLPQVIHDLVLL